MIKNLSLISISFIICFWMLIIPGLVFEFTSIHTFKSYNFIKYQWLQSPFSILFFVSIPFLILLFNTIYFKKIFQFLLFIFFWDIITSNLTAYNNNFYESYINFFVGIVFSGIIIKYSNNNYENILKIVENLILINAVLQLLSFLVGIGVDYNRFFMLRLNFPFLSSNETAFLCGIGILLFLRKKKYFKILLLIIALFTTGSRGPIFFLIISYLIFFLFNFKKSFKTLFKPINLLIIITFLVLIYFILTKFNLTRSFSGLGELISNPFDTDFEDTSFIGRFLSLKVGLDLLIDNPFGLSFCFNDVQYGMNNYGYPTFPHSTLLYSYLVMGPLLSLFLYFKFFKSLLLDKFLQAPIFIYILLYLTFSGGALVNFKFIFFLAIFYYLIDIINESINRTT